MKSSQMHILVTGGAGYIGSHVVVEALKVGHAVTVLDDFSSGHEETVRDTLRVPVIKGSTLNLEVVIKALDSKVDGKPVDAIIHLADKAYVEESIRKPLIYYNNNMFGTVNLIKANVRQAQEMSRKPVPIIFSSSCTVYAPAKLTKLTEDQELKPTSPYGRTKVISERLLYHAHRKSLLPFVSLRFFNAAGASQTAEIGESHSPETHLIPTILQSAQSGTPVKIFGLDYETEDGSCIRDYVHVEDLARAHLLSLDFVSSFSENRIRLTRLEDLVFNLGSDVGYSVLEVVEKCEQISRNKVVTVSRPRRLGDQAYAVADSTRARSVLGWRPIRSDLDSIIRDAWKWHNRSAKELVKE